MAALEFSGPAIRLTADDLIAAATAADMDVDLIRAVTAVEASSKGGFLPPPDGRPLILFEAEQFDRLTHARYRQSHPTLSTATWNRSLYSATSAGEWARLMAAIELDRDAALQAASWGLFQIMGFNYALCGQASVADFVAANVASEASQLQLFLTFLKANPQEADSLRRHQWDAYAAAYNGPSYRSNGYAVKLAAAYQAAVNQPLVPSAPVASAPADTPPVIQQPPASDPAARRTNQVTNVRIGPGWWQAQTDDSPIASDTVVTVIGQKAGWMSVVWTKPDGNVAQGWVEGDRLERSA